MQKGEQKGQKRYGKRCGRRVNLKKRLAGCLCAVLACGIWTFTNVDFGSVVYAEPAEEIAGEESAESAAVNEEAENEDADGEKLDESPEKSGENVEEISDENQEITEEISEEENEFILPENAEETETPETPVEELMEIESLENAAYTLTYRIENDGTATITGYTGTASGNLVIPEKIDGHSVSSIEAYAFSGCSGFSGDLIIGDGVSSIGRVHLKIAAGLAEV